VKLITDLSELSAIEDAWRDLACARGNAFVTPEWLRSWLGHCGERAKPFVIAVSREDGSLAGVLPLVRVREGRRQVLRFAGAELGNYFHPACHEDEELRVIDECSRILEIADALIVEEANLERRGSPGHQTAIEPERCA